MHKKTLLTLIIILLLVLITGCINTQDASTILPDKLPVLESKWQDAPVGDSKSINNTSAILHYLSSDGQRLVSIVDTIEVTEGETLIEAVVEKQLSHPTEADVLPVANGDIRLLSAELSQEIATVNLSIDAKSLDADRLHFLRYAITQTLTEMQDVKFVNVLINGQENGIIQLPTGTLSHTNNSILSIWTQVKSEEERFEQSDKEAWVLNRDVTLYFGVLGQPFNMLPELRNIRINGVNYAGAIMRELFKGPTDMKDLQRLLPPDQSYMQKEPEIILDVDSNKLVAIYLQGDVNAYFTRNNISKQAAYGSIVQSICGFVPEVDGVVIYIDGDKITSIDDGDEFPLMRFDDGIMRRHDFESLISRFATIYLPSIDESALIALKRAVSQYDARTPRSVMRALIKGALPTETNVISTMPPQTSDADIIGIRLEGNCALINLSGNFYRNVSAYTAISERNLVYAMVNTLTDLPGIRSVKFFIDSQSLDTLSSTINIYGELLRNPGIIRQGE